MIINNVTDVTAVTTFFSELEKGIGERPQTGGQPRAALAELHFGGYIGYTSYKLIFSMGYRVTMSVTCVVTKGRNTYRSIENAGSLRG
jgi:hypothetical protein